MGMSRESETAERVLLAVAEPELGPDVIASIRDHVNGRRPQVMVVAPALIGSAIKHAMGDVDEARGEADGILQRSLGELRSAGVDTAGGQVGDSDPVLAIKDALATFDAEEIVIVTRPHDDARWLEGDLFERARHEFEQPIVHLEVEAADAGGVVAEEEAGRGVEPDPEDGFEGYSRNTPRLSTRDTVGIIVAVIGSILAIVLAATAGGDEIQRNGGSGGAGSNGSAVFAYIVAGVITLINVAHVVGLMLFEAAEYRGGWARTFSWLSLVGTPIAVILVLIAR
jgi:hypothetical protein